MQVIKLSSYQVESQENILKKPLAERLALVKEITDGISDEKKTKQDAIILLNRIEDEIYQNSVEKAANNLALCQKTRAALYDRGAPVKMILENLMICLD
jgi:ribosomal protein L31E